MGNKKRRFADDGWALWIDGDDRSTIYLNEWINPKGRSYVDISVRVYGAKEAKTVNFFVPFVIEENEITDEFLELVKAELPKQPWPAGVHKTIAAKLGCTNGKVYRSIDMLIEKGYCREQKDGVIL